jgi:hypothetical protein
VVQGSPHDAGAIRDTIARVFEASRYDRSARRTIGDYLLDALGRAFSAVIDALEASATLRTAAWWLGIALVAIVVGRLVYLAYLRERVVAGTGGSGERGFPREDPLAAAQRSAGEGNYLDATHHLYAALLQHLARGGRVRLHASKTAGDYARDLRAQQSPAWDAFRRFVGGFEYIVYGRRACDRDDFDRLRGLAEPVLRGE